ncbi:MAG: class I SAM-dependent methyltransferase [Flavobacteriales bacterium]|nr:class I SAM-dependent methyltransferase [Flavobacteriales bacterium]
MNREESIARGFDYLAKNYNFFLKFTIGKAIHRSQTCFFKHIKNCQIILIVGGGTGKLLVEVLKNYPDVHVDYVDVSSRMIEQSRLRITKETPGRIDKVNFINTDILNHNGPNSYDVILTPFILDCFNERDLALNIKHLWGSLKSNGIWLHSDFNPHPKNIYSKIFSRIMISSLYLFFNTLCKLDVSLLPDFKKIYLNLNFKIDEEQLFLGGLISSLLLHKA